MSDDHLANLNKQQRKAALHGRKHPKIKHKPLLVIAGAGSGKTRVIAARVAEILLKGVDPARILLLTFSNKAAREMVDRVLEVTGRSLKGGQDRFPWAGTFHSVAVKMLRKFGNRVGISPSFTILDRSDAEDLMGMVRHDLGLSEKRGLFPKKDKCLAIYSMRLNSASSLKRVLRERFPLCRRWHRELKALFKAFEATKREQNVIDYDDMLWLWWKILQDPRRAREIGALFDHVLVDEYQDTNRLQAKILLALKPDGNGVTVVGDDAQAIYSFRAATVRNILEFPEHFAPQARIVTLEQNYRSTQPLLKACNKVISFAKDRYTKNLFSKRHSDQKPFITTVRDGTAQARHVAARILAAREVGIPLRDQAVLFRSSSHSGQLEIELERRGIPFVKWGGIKFLEASHIKDVLSVLRWCHNPQDRMAAVRALQLLPGIGPRSACDIFEQTKGSDFVARLRSTQPHKGAVQEWRGFTKTVRAICNARKPWPAEFNVLCDWFEPQCERIYQDDAEKRISDLNQFKEIAATFRSRETFLTELTLDPPDVSIKRTSGEERTEDFLILSTIHSAKGQEWRSVTILNVLEGCIPIRQATKSTDSVEEERRLLYVAMTRAKDQLDLVVPQFHHSHGAADIKQLAQRSRFVPQEFLAYFDCRTG